MRGITHVHLPGDLQAVLAQLFVFTALGVTYQFGMW